VEVALNSYDKRGRGEALREIELIAQKHGVALKDLVQDGSKRGVQVPTYKPGEACLDSDRAWTAANLVQGSDGCRAEPG
jgi:hypothetical protein